MSEFENTVLKRTGRCLIFFIMLLLSNILKINAQNIRFGIFADPVIGWFSSDTRATVNDGARAGFNFGFTFNKYFADNYSFSTGLSIVTAGGRLYHRDTLTMEFNNLNVDVPPYKPVIYRIQYINLPLGLKFETNQIGYITFFTDIGLDPKLVAGGKADIPFAGIKSETAIRELNRFNLGYHISGGLSYSLGGTTEIVAGLGYEKNFLDVTKDLHLQPDDRVTLNLMRFRIGINF